MTCKAGNKLSDGKTVCKKKNSIEVIDYIFQRDVEMNQTLVIATPILKSSTMTIRTKYAKNSSMVDVEGTRTDLILNKNAKRHAKYKNLDEIKILLKKHW